MLEFIRNNNLSLAGEQCVIMFFSSYFAGRNAGAKLENARRKQEKDSPKKKKNTLPHFFKKI